MAKGSFSNHDQRHLPAAPAGMARIDCHPAGRSKSLPALASAARRTLAAHSLAARLLGLGLSASAAMIAAGCGSSAANDPVFDPRILQHNERMSAEAYAPPPRPFSTTREALPTTRQKTTRDSGTTLPTTIPLGGLAGTDAPLVSMGLREVIQRAVANSAEVRVAGYDPAVNAQKVIQAQAQFDPAYFANVTLERQDTQTPGTFIIVPPTARNNGQSLLTYNKVNIYTWEGGIEQNLVAGGKASLSFQTDETDFDKPTDYRSTNPYWENQIKFQVTQPLLRGFGTEVNAAKITIAKDDQRISTLEFRKTLEDTIDMVEQDYWQLYEAEQEVLYDQQLVDSSLQTYTVLDDRERHGVDKDAGGGVPAAQAETRVKANQAVLLAAQAHVRDISEDLKRRMNDPVFPVAGPMVLLASDKPLQLPIEFNLKDQIDTALDNRLELGEQQNRIDESAILLLTARNGELPQLDIVANAAVQGLGQDFKNAQDNQGDFNHVSYSIGVQFSLPIGNRAAKSATRQAQLQRLQAIEQYRNLITQVTLDVELNWDSVYNSFKQAERRQQSRLAAERQLRLINQQEIVGTPLTPPFVQVKLQAQEDLATAQREEAIALANYNVAIEKLEKSKGTLLRYDNVVMEEDPVISRDNGRRQGK